MGKEQAGKAEWPEFRASEPVLELDRVTQVTVRLVYSYTELRDEDRRIVLSEACGPGILAYTIRNKIETLAWKVRAHHRGCLLTSPNVHSVGCARTHTRKNIHTETQTQITKGNDENM